MNILVGILTHISVTHTHTYTLVFCNEQVWHGLLSMSVDVDSCSSFLMAPLHSIQWMNYNYVNPY